MSVTLQSYVLLSEYNDYDQHGAYFVAWFLCEPTVEEVCAVLRSDYGALPELFDYDSLARHILFKGGRRGSENVWYTLKRVKSSNAP